MDLKELLGEELYNQVVEKAGDNKVAVVSDGNWFPKDKFDTVNNENKDLKQQISDRDTQLEDLGKKVKDNKELTHEIDRLKQENQTATQELQEKLDNQAYEFALDKALVSEKVKNTKAVKALLDTEKIKLDGEKLLNLDDQLKELKESDAYLFEQEQQQEPPKPNFTTGQHQTGTGINPKDFKKMSYKERLELKRENPEQYKSLSGK